MNPINKDIHIHDDKILYQCLISFGSDSVQLDQFTILLNR